MIRAGGGVLANFSHGMADPFSYANADRDVEQVFFCLSVCAFYLRSELYFFGPDFCALFFFSLI